jgi:2-polyprenyl-3-methyl-5-hydroxy-6-metoxy-1,4-benzoquinol methylase
MPECLLCSFNQWEEVQRGNGYYYSRCTRCGLIQSSAVTVAEKEKYQKEYYYFDEKNNTKRRLLKRKLLRFISPYMVANFHSRFKLLDVGCGMGLFLKELKSCGITGEGTDISKVSVAKAREEGFTCYLETLEQTRKSGRKYDVVTLLEVLEHLADPVAELKNIHRILNDSGILILSTPNADSSFTRLFGRHWFGFDIPKYHIALYGRKSIQELADKGEWKDVKILSTCINPARLVKSSINYSLLGSMWKINNPYLKRISSVSLLLFAGWFFYLMAIYSFRKDKLVVIMQK